MLKQDPLNMNSKRSIMLIVDAMLDLMSQKAYKKISISEITSHAGVVRSTFYAHFTNKEDILSYYLFQVFKAKFDDNQRPEGLLDSEFVKLYFEIWSEQIGFLKQLMDNELLMVLNQLDNHFEFICKSYFTSGQDCLPSKTMKYANAFYADALASILKRWVKTGMEETTEELTEVFIDLATYDYTR